jgi:beta-lactamase regulating signal transducer with metallopeptidase domain
LNEKTLAIVWAAGAATVLLAYFRASLSFRRQFSRSGRRAGKRTEQAVSDCSRTMGLKPIPVVEMDALSGPALFGVWRPRLLFPLGLADQLSDEELRLVVLHELGHLKRRDLFLQGLLVVSQAVHWFNPLVWLAGRLAREDRELACDEFVMAHTSHSGGHAYAKTLLRVLGLSRPGRPMLPAVGILETKNQLKQRIIMITNYQSTNAWRLVLGAASILAVSAGLLIAAEAGNTSATATPAAATSGAPKGWVQNGSDPKASKAYEVGVDSTQPYKKPVSVYVKSLGPKTSEDKYKFGGMMQMCRAESFRGKRLKFTGYVKTLDVAGTANLWFRVDGENGKILAFDNMSDRPIKGTTDWKEYSVVLDVPETATALAYGIFVSGSGAGTAWLNDVQLIEVGSGVKSTNMEAANTYPLNKVPDAPQNLDFSSGKSSDADTDNSESRKPQPSNAGVLARVNNLAITIDQVDSVAGKRENEIRQKFTGVERERQIAEARKQALEDLINRELLLQEFRSRDYSISEKTIDDHIQDVIETHFSGNRAAFLSQLEGHGYTLETFKEVEREKIRVQAMRQSIVKDTQDVQQREQKLNEWFASARKKAAITMY